MRRALSFSAVWLAAAFALGCESATEPTSLVVETVVAPLTERPDPASGRVNGNAIEIVGALGTPDPCYSFGARATLRSDTLHVRLQATSSAEACIQIVGQWRYSLAVRDVPLGEWNVVLVYDVRGGGPPETLFSGRLLINAQP